VSELSTQPIENGLLVFLGERCIAGLGHHWYRPWLHPLYTPAGHPVLDAFPFDHPFHNGCFVAQNPVIAAGREANFWAVPPSRQPDDELFRNVGRVEVLALGIPVMKCVWRDPHGGPVLDEERSFDFRRQGEAVVCDVTSRKTAAYDDLEFPATKFGGIAVRVDAQLLPAAGGRIVGRHGEASPFVAYENGRFGLALIGSDPAVPWFLRDYGLATHNPTWREPLALKKGETWETRLRLVAYDGAVPGWIGSSR
jgi:hypothetical protein